MSEVYISTKQVLRDKIPQFLRDFGINKINVSTQVIFSSNKIPKNQQLSYAIQRFMFYDLILLCK